ncbi:Zn-dependent hydrolase [Streptomonospora wellingtoniae]|uniref:Zn-dependent hydrolase n=1 Tax=Streptomonospora wellingtoniae TaxID=3075544 RepID=A0ABU2KY61_9ACTN|nr:Zn-dependent hydrolase [Streptomonospora sp. DSM 45055]MDT0304244.1 Zn-dependent hydrolase [Streptomonospora sp. DSM 45055]
MTNPSAPAVPPCSADRIRDDVETLATFTEPSHPGWTRRAYSKEYTSAREWLASRMADCGLRVRRDAANNLIGTCAGRAGGRALATGSHTDTVEGGGRFDGIAGVLTALEAVRTLHESGITLHHELRVVDFFNEEANAYGLSCVGSRALAGALSQRDLALTDATGESLAQGLARAGGDPASVADCAWTDDELAAFVELHIEQGPVLEQQGYPLAVVTAIAGIDRHLLEFTGQPDHAGATPMDMRRDALCAAAEAVLAVEELAGADGSVGTSGRLEVEPGAANVVPGTARVWAEFRAADRERLDAAASGLGTAAREAAAKRGVEVQVHPLSSVSPVAADPGVQDVLASAADRHGMATRRLFSGAGHDSAHMALLCPIGMLFVPSHGGRSHCPEEWTDPEDLAAGARALAQALVDLDRSADRA